MFHRRRRYDVVLKCPRQADLSYPVSVVRSPNAAACLGRQNVLIRSYPQHNMIRKITRPDTFPLLVLVAAPWV